MATRVHLHLHAADLEASREFYERFFGVAPVKRLDGYVKFLPDLAPLNLALSPGRQGEGPGSPVSHMGVQVDSTEEVMAQLARVRASGLPVRVEMDVNCCHANQDKFWVTDPDGLQWEVYHLNRDVPEEPPAAHERRKAVALPMADACCAHGSAR